MPFTPFHMGAALIVKPAARQHFSVLAFGVAQVAMDIEPMIGMIRDWDVLHGPSHTILGALGITALVASLSIPLCNFLLQRFNQEVVHHKMAWLKEPYPITKTAALTGAFFGTLSHLVLDCLMHHDIHPLAPFTSANPLMDLVSHDGVYQLCVVLGLIGTVAWLGVKRYGRI
jgi:hypothetical protein